MAEWELEEGLIDEIAELVLDYVQMNDLVVRKVREAKDLYFGRMADEFYQTIIQYKAMSKAQNNLVIFQGRD